MQSGIPTWMKWCSMKWRHFSSIWYGGPPRPGSEWIQYLRMIDEPVQPSALYGYSITWYADGSPDADTHSPAFLFHFVYQYQTLQYFIWTLLVKLVNTSRKRDNNYIIFKFVYYSPNTLSPNIRKIGMIRSISSHAPGTSNQRRTHAWHDASHAYINVNSLGCDL